MPRAHRTTRELSAPLPKVFAAIQDPTRLAQRWGPNGFTNTFDLFEFKPDGKWVFAMIGPDGRVYRNESVFGAIERDRQVIIHHVSAPKFILTISLESTAAGTRGTWEQGFDDPAVANAIRHIVEPGNEQNLDRLAATVQS